MCLNCLKFIHMFFELLSNTISYFDLSDLDNFKIQTVRSAVNVREGQGVVLLCGPPMHSGGEFTISIKCVMSAIIQQLVLIKQSDWLRDVCYLQ